MIFTYLSITLGVDDVLIYHKIIESLIIYFRLISSFVRHLLRNISCIALSMQIHVRIIIHTADAIFKMQNRIFQYDVNEIKKSAKLRYTRRQIRFTA